MSWNSPTTFLPARIVVLGVTLTFDQYLGLPTISHIDVASPKEPYLGLRLVLDLAVVTSTMVGLSQAT